MPNCDKCGREYTRTGMNQKYCAACRDAANRERSLLYDRRKYRMKKQADGRNTSIKTLAEADRIARSHGRSYGQAVAEGLI